MSDLSNLDLYREVLDTLPSALVVIDRNGLIVAANRAWTEFSSAHTDIASSAFAERNYLQLSTELMATAVATDGQTLVQGVQMIFAGGAEESWVYSWHSPQQGRWYQVRVTRMPHTPLLLIIHEDVTESRAVEDVLEDQIEFVRSLLLTSPDCLEVLSLEGKLLWRNGTAQRLLSLSVAEINTQEPGGADWFQSWPPDSQTAVRQALETARAGGRGTVQAYRAAPGGLQRYWDAVLTGIPGPDGLIYRVLVTSRDLTDIQPVKDEWINDPRYARQAFESTQQAWFSLDTEWRFQSLNERAQTILQHSTSELRHQSLWQVFPQLANTEASEHYHVAMRERRSVQFEYFHSPLASWFEIRLYPQSSGLTVYFRDIGVKKVEERAQHDRNTILEMTVQGAALHEILVQVALMVERQYPGYACTILLNQQGNLYTSAAPSLSPEFQRAVDGLEVREGAGVCGTAVFRGELVVVEDTMSAPSCTAFVDVMQANQLLACASLPIIDGLGVVLGALALYARQPGPFPTAVLTELDKARHLAAVAIEHHLLTRRLTYQTKHDALTGLANRVMFEERLQQAIGSSHETGSPVALLFLDVDDFKGVNDSLGHHAGDQVLRGLAERLQACVGPGDTLARMSGDEFTIILPLSTEDAAVQVAQCCLKALERPFLALDREIYLTASIGISVSPLGGQDAETLQRSADLAMYHAKTQKVGWALFETSLNHHAYERFQMAGYLRRAIELNELEVHYQPQVLLADHSIVAVEALLRWNHPVLGRVSPAQFIPVAEETGLIVALGHWVLREVCRQGMRWLQEGRPPIRVAVNVSALQFDRADFVPLVASCLQETRFPANHLELELTERLVMRNVEASVRRMEQLRELGVSISIDDFGTGASSLSYLPRLPINILKIDRSFITELRRDSANYLVVKAILNLAESLDLLAIAEGIETAEELQILRYLGCTLGQGYLFARPEPASEHRWFSVRSQES
ncbi:EAL domain-containing protein (plasmid) [Deinococcus sp. KNUC1210]|uniref:EAL domain-containing protein n=1 Tax=Deinococcus sp. KNUC1210 TaxID=2917691 RepID=UPI001EF14811|nr:EAL domain-containing protein [Deinococcus sp. KNUC1210]ULH13851.1 EAL domain-containing protein [Deinococcus sp. KNUC1210]